MQLVSHLHCIVDLACFDDVAFGFAWLMIASFPIIPIFAFAVGVIVVSFAVGAIIVSFAVDAAIAVFSTSFLIVPFAVCVVCRTCRRWLAHGTEAFWLVWGGCRARSRRRLHRHLYFDRKISDFVK